MMKCTKNNCIKCGTHRDELDDHPWATDEGGCSCGSCSKMKPFFNAIICNDCEQQRKDKAITDYQENWNKYTHQHNSDPICPYCGYKNEDAWEYGVDCGFTYDCENCNHEVECIPHVEITYSTFKQEIEK